MLHKNISSWRCWMLAPSSEHFKIRSKVASHADIGVTGSLKCLHSNSFRPFDPKLSTSNNNMLWIGSIGNRHRCIAILSTLSSSSYWFGFKLQGGRHDISYWSQGLANNVQVKFSKSTNFATIVSCRVLTMKALARKDGRVF